MSKQAVRRIGLKFDDNALVPLLFGEHDSHLSLIEEGLDVEIAARGNEIMITGTKNNLVFGLGPAGTGKTFLAVAQAVQFMLEGKVDRLILCRPAVEAGERLGFLPGTMQEKIDPYLRPIYDALHDMLPPEQIAKRLADGTIEIAPLAFMRGRTLSSAFVILDEAQNTTTAQMKMVLTRLGEGSRIIVTGDLSQTDLPTGTMSGLKDALDVLRGAPDIAIISFTEGEVVRSRLVKTIVNAYEKRDGKSSKNVSSAIAS